jgi:hypothetical protein
VPHRHLRPQADRIASCRPRAPGRACAPPAATAGRAGPRQLSQRDGPLANGVGLDTPGPVHAAAPAGAGYAVEGPEDAGPHGPPPRRPTNWLPDRATGGGERSPAAYRAWFDALPLEAKSQCREPLGRARGRHSSTATPSPCPSTAWDRRRWDSSPRAATTSTPRPPTTPPDLSPAPLPRPSTSGCRDASAPTLVAYGQARQPGSGSPGKSWPSPPSAGPRSPWAPSRTSTPSSSTTPARAPRPSAGPPPSSSTTSPRP